MDGKLVKMEANNFFRKLFIFDRSPGTFLSQQNHVVQLSDVTYIALLGAVSKDEVQQASKFMKAFIAPGPDSFQPFFFKKFWHILGDDIWHLVQDAFEKGYFDASHSNRKSSGKIHSLSAH